MRITALQLQNIGVFKNQEIHFPDESGSSKAEIHIFTGINGSGKSTLLKALMCGFDYSPEFNQSECSGTTNSFTKYLKFVNDENKIEDCSGGVLLDNNEIIEFWGCLRGNRDVHLHIPTESKRINDYRVFLNPEREIFPNKKFDFALFAYSGYRFLDYSSRTNPSVFTKKDQNPLFQSLELNKKPNPDYSFDSWIMTSLLKRGYAKENNIESKIEEYDDTIKSLEDAIGEIIGFEIRFVLDNSLRHVKIQYRDQQLDLEAIPDGMKSIISWLADLCSRLERLDWIDDTPVFKRNIILFLDEIENHLHIKWQRKVLGVVQKLLPNAQIFVSTHSPFVVNSVDGAWLHRLDYDEKTNLTTVSKPTSTKTGNSYIFELLRTFGIDEEFGEATQKKLERFHIDLKNAKQGKPINKESFLALAKELSEKSTSLNNEIQIELAKLNKQTQNEFSIW